MTQTNNTKLTLTSDQVLLLQDLLRANKRALRRDLVNSKDLLQDTKDDMNYDLKLTSQLLLNLG